MAIKIFQIVIVAIICSCSPKPEIDLEYDDWGAVDSAIEHNRVWNDWDGELPIPFSEEWYKLNKRKEK